MGNVADYRKRAEQCRKRAMRGDEDWAHYVEMAQTWEKLADLHDLGRKLRSSGVLFSKPVLPAE